MADDKKDYIKKLAKKYKAKPEQKADNLKWWEIYVNGKFQFRTAQETKQEAEAEARDQIDDPRKKIEVKGPFETTGLPPRHMRSLGKN